MSDAPPPAVRRAFAQTLTRWFTRQARDLPWRRDRTPYRVWISELMLQQTRVDQALPYYERFLRDFPDVRALAAAPLDRVLKRWEGLGYYARARHAHRAARHLMTAHGGEFPRTHRELLALPGVGPYTAAAVGSLAFGLDLAVVDGNVARVLARVFAYGEPVNTPAARRQLQGWADALLPAGRAGVFNEAMMELGATVCRPRRPDCARCPLRRVCAARREGNPEGYPLQRRRRPVPHRHVGAGIIVDDRDRVLLARRPEDGMLGGLWEFPGGGVEEGETPAQCIARELREELGIEVRVGPHLHTVRHAFSHFTMDLHGHWVRVARGRPRPLQCAAVRWVARRDLRRYAFPRADLHLLDLVEATRPFPRF